MIPGTIIVTCRNNVLFIVSDTLYLTFSGEVIASHEVIGHQTVACALLSSDKIMVYPTGDCFYPT